MELVENLKEEKSTMNLPRTSMKIVSLIVILWIGIVAIPYQAKAQTDLGAVYNIEWSPDGEKIATLKRIQDSYSVEIFASSNLQSLAVFSIPQPTNATDLDWSSDGNYIAVWTSNAFNQPIIEIWDVLTSQTLLQWQVENVVAVNGNVSWRPNNDQVAFTGNDTIYLLDIGTETIVQQLQYKREVIFTQLAWSPDSNILAANNSGELRLWDTTSSTYSRILSNDILGAFAWNDTGSQIAAVVNSDIKIWDIALGQVAKTLQGNNLLGTIDWQEQLIVGYSTDGLDQHNFYIWNSNIEQVMSLTEGTDFTYSVSFRPNSTLVAYGTKTSVPIIFNPIMSICDGTQVTQATNITELINAITNANSNPDTSVIGLAAGTYNFVTANNPLNALPKITTDVTICSQDGATLTHQSGSPQFRLFEVAAGGSLTLENVTLSGGSVTNEPGGAIANYGTLNLTDVTFTGNQALTGGAIYLSSDSRASVQNSCFEDNSLPVVVYDGAITQNFTGNWWGSADGPTIEIVSGELNTANFLTTGCPLP